MNTTRVSLRVKFSVMIIIFSASILLASFLFVGMTIYVRNQSFLAENLLRATAQLVEYFSSTVRDGLVLDDDILLVNTFDKIKNMDNIEFAVLFDKNRQVRLHSEAFARSGLTADDPSLSPLIGETNLRITPAFNPREIQSAYTISRSFMDAKGRFLGLLYVRYSTAALSSLMGGIRAELIRNMQLILGASILVAVLFGVILAMQTVKPIRVIVRGMEIVGQGDLDFHIPMKRNDELGYLSDTFNTMTDRIRESQKILVENKRQEEQMQVAKSIQESIFPEQGITEPQFEIASFTVAAKLVGGDYHFFQKVDPDTVYFVVADVSGKGVPAALITFMLSTVIRSTIDANRKYSAGFVLGETNRLLYPEMEKVGQFATAMLGFYSISSRTVNFASAGHGDLYIYRSAKQAFVKATNTYRPIGLTADSVYKSASFTLNPGDYVVIMTDGITEARNDQGLDYGAARLLSHKSFRENLPARELTERLRRDVQDFAGSAEQHDDMTLLILKQKSF